MTQAELDQKRQAAIELANAYREMMAMFAWKHLTGVLFERIRKEATNAVDEVPIADLTLGNVAESRGIRRAFALIEAEITWILNNSEPTTRKSGG